MSDRWQFPKHALLIIVTFELSLSIGWQAHTSSSHFHDARDQVQGFVYCRQLLQPSAPLSLQCLEEQFHSFGFGLIRQGKEAKKWWTESWGFCKNKHQAWKKGCVCWGSFRGWTWGQGTAQWFCNVDVSVRTVVVNGRSRSLVWVVKRLMETYIFGNILD